MTDRILTSLIGAIGVAVFERCSGGSFSLLGEPPRWYQRFLGATGPDQGEVAPGGVFPFVAYFLSEAQQVWASSGDGDGGPLTSGVWSQADEQGVDHAFRVSVLTLRGRQLLLIIRLDREDEVRRSLLEKARDNRLSFEHDMAVRERQEAMLLITQGKLEQCVADRTVELASINEALRDEITERRRVEARLLRHQRQLRRLASQLSLAEERERRRIAAGMHDDVGQFLAIAKVKLMEHTEVGTPTDPGWAGSVLELVDQALASTRSLTFELSPPSLYDLGLEAALEGLAEQARSRYGFDCDFKDDGCSKPIEEEVKVVLFQAARELLLNVAKHARAQHVQIKTHRIPAGIRLVVDDDGVGFDPGQAGARFDQAGGFGLFNIRERLKHIGAVIRFDSSPVNGTRVIVDAPLVFEQAPTSGCV